MDLGCVARWFSDHPFKGFRCSRVTTGKFDERFIPTAPKLLLSVAKSIVKPHRSEI